MNNPSEQIEFWLLESRTPSLLREVAGAYADSARRLSARRSFLDSIALIEDREIEDALEREEKRERDLDREYWKPLREELERLRLAR